MRNLPQSLADLEFKEASEEHAYAYEEVKFKKILHRHYKDKNYHQLQRKAQEEYHNLKEASLEMGEAEAAFHKIMQARQKLVDVYRDLMIKSHSDATP